MKNLYFLFIMFGILFSSCYTRELYYSFEPSHGGVVVGSSYYYLAQVREFRKPKGISRFPDGGMSREERQIFGLFRTDSVENKTHLVYRMDDICCWPARFSTRMDKNESYIVFGIINVNFPDSLDGIYLYNISSKTLKRYSQIKSLPAISGNNRIAFCVENKLTVNDLDGIQLFSYILNAKPVYITWNDGDEIFIYFSEPFMVQKIKLSTGKTTTIEKEYLPNYAQERTKTQILKVIRDSNPDLKGFLNE